MSEIDEMRARAEELGIKVDRRWGATKLAQVISEAHADGFATEADREATYGDAVQSRDWGGGDTIEHDDDVQPVDADWGVTAGRQEGPDDGWPKRIAPCAWLDQDGNRWTDLGRAGEAVDAIRRRR